MNTYYPGSGKPNGAERSNAPGTLAPLLAPTALDAEVTALLEQSIYNMIFGTTPEPYFASLRLLMFDKAPAFHASDEYSWYEMPDQRVPIVVDNGVAAPGTILTPAQAAAVGNGFVTANIPIPDSLIAAVGVNVRLHFRVANGWATVLGVTPGTPSTVQIQSLAGVGLPAIVQGDIITVGGEVRADNEDRIVNTSRAQTLRRTNFVTTIMRTLSYGRKEQLKWQNGATTNFLDMERQNIINQLKFDAMLELWNGDKRLQRQDTGNTYAKGTDGIKTQMLNGGVTPQVTTLGNLQSAVEQAMINTNYGTGTLYAIGTTEILLEISKAYKELQTRYTPNDRIADLDLSAVKVGGRTLVLTPAEAFKDNAYFPGWDNHLFLLDRGSVNMNGMQGMPYLDVAGMMKNRLLSFTDPRGSLLDRFTFPAEMTFGPSVVNPPANALLYVN